MCCQSQPPFLIPSHRQRTWKPTSLTTLNYRTTTTPHQTTYIHRVQNLSASPKESPSCQWTVYPSHAKPSQRAVLYTSREFLPECHQPNYDNCFRPLNHQYYASSSLQNQQEPLHAASNREDPRSDNSLKVGLSFRTRKWLKRLLNS